MDILILTGVRLFGEGLERCLQPGSDISVISVVHDLTSLRDALDRLSVDLVLVDITQGFICNEIRSLANDYPGAVLLALGLREQEKDVIECGQAGFAGYVPRDASIETLRQRMLDAHSGKLNCPDDIAAGLLKALYRGRFTASTADDTTLQSVMTVREAGVARLVSYGYSNKEIARELTLSVATVKHHVHSILEKLKLTSRAQVIRKVREEPWLLATSEPGRRHGHPPRRVKVG